jgi:hypothetical protein
MVRPLVIEGGKPIGQADDDHDDHCDDHEMAYHSLSFEGMGSDIRNTPLIINLQPRM